MLPSGDVLLLFISRGAGISLGLLVATVALSLVVFIIRLIDGRHKHSLSVMRLVQVGRGTVEYNAVKVTLNWVDMKQ